MVGRDRTAALSLYRGILRAHRKLPAEMRQLGDAYVRSEFKLHKPVTNEAQLGAFYSAWDQYVDHLRMSARRKESIDAGALDEKEGAQELGFGQHLEMDLELSDEQKEQLEKLREEATRAGK